MEDKKENLKDKGETIKNKATKMFEKYNGFMDNTFNIVLFQEDMLQKV